MVASLEERIDALYQLPPDEFTAARAALAKELTGPQATSVKSLKKPTAVPWAVNQLYWRAQLTYRRLLQRGQALRTAQLAVLKGRAADLRQAAEAHRLVVGEAVHQATQIAAEADLKPNAEQLARMFEAISLAATPPARPGRFTEVLQPAAFEALTGITPAKGKHSIAPRAETKPAKPSAAARRIERQREQKARADQKRAKAELDVATRALTRAQAAEARAQETRARAEANVRAAEKAVRRESVKL